MQSPSFLLAGLASFRVINPELPLVGNHEIYPVLDMAPEVAHVDRNWQALSVINEPDRIVIVFIEASGTSVSRMFVEPRYR